MNPTNRNIFNFINIMSRRKQSNPKPLLKRDDEEDFPSEENATKKPQTTESDEIDEQKSESEFAMKSNSSENNEEPGDEIDECKTEKSPKQVMPALRLNVALASDPATNPDAKELLNIHIKSELKSGEDEDEEDFQNPNNNNNDKDPTIPDVLTVSQIQSQRSNELLHKSKENINNINQMLAKNLEILPRQNVYMCAPCSIRFSSLSTLEAHQTYYCSHRKDADENANKSSTISSETNGSEPPTKAIKTGKQYACTQCSYSADKKVSLNRHMRMHQTSPAPSSIATSNGDDTSSSQIIVPASIIGPSQPIVDRYCSDCDIRFSSTKTYRAHKQHYCSSRHQGQPSAILSPNAIASNVPATSKSSKSESQTPPDTSKTPPSPTSPFLALPTNPIIIIPYSLIRNSSIIPGPLSTVAQVTNPDSTCFIFQNGALQPIAYSIAASVVAGSSNAPQQASPRLASQNIINEIKVCKPSSSGNVANEALKSLNKRDGIVNRESTTPLDLSVHRRISPNSRERSLSISSAISAEHFRMEFDSMMEGKENISVSGDSITPEQIVCAPSLPGSPPLTPSRRSNSPRGSSVSMSPNSSTPHSVLMRPLFPADIALRLSDPSLNVIPPLVKQSMELALRLSSTNSNEATNTQQISPSQPITSTGITTPTQIPAQIFVKTGISKCKECNIVFCKYENYLAHKKHYCSARNIEETDGNSTEAAANPTISPPSVIPNHSQTYQQLICLACGIKFASLDNLNAHQMYYCPKRNDLQAQPSPVPTIPVLQKDKCVKCKTTHDSSQNCAQGAHYKCPICDVVSPNSSEARRHMESHGGVKAFRCTICRYKGNTLRGMRTHIRMHIDKKTGDVNEENYISCILDDDSTEIPPSNSVNKASSPHDNVKKNCSKSQPKTNSPEKQDVKVITATISSSAIKKEQIDDDIKSIDNNSEVVDDEILSRDSPDIPTNIIKIESDGEILTQHFNNSKSPKKQSHDEKSQSPKIVNIVQLEDTTSPKPIDSPNDSKYCSNCDISFTYSHTFIAHKQFYCKGKANSANNGTSPNGSSVNVTLAAETSV